MKVPLDHMRAEEAMEDFGWVVLKADVPVGGGHGNVALTLVKLLDESAPPDNGSARVKIDFQKRLAMPAASCMGAVL